jgi:hypothetical protein
MMHASIGKAVMDIAAPRNNSGYCIRRNLLHFLAIRKAKSVG